jgi:predicted metal-dependent hydrolase
MQFLSLPSHITICDNEIPLILRENNRAKRLTLRWIAQKGEVVMTYPPRLGRSQIYSFLQKSLPWIEKQVSKTQVTQSFSPGMILPILGKPLELRHRISSTQRTWWGEDHILIHSPQEKLAICVQKSLKQAARAFLQKRTNAYANQISRTVNRITLKDMSTRWGSCTAEGNISYCWRLIFAPEDVADYVCAHEVGHLKEMNHSPKFWKIVSDICPDYTSHRQWLKQNGKGLFQYGL